MKNIRAVATLLLSIEEVLFSHQLLIFLKLYIFSFSHIKLDCIKCQNAFSLKLQVLLKLLRSLILFLKLFYSILEVEVMLRYDEHGD